MANAYTPPEAEAGRKRADGQKLTLAGVVLAGAGIAGIVISTLLKVVWLGILGGPIAGLSWLALIVGVGLFVWGFQMIKAAHPYAGKT
jgi:hypothetical protein